MEIVTEQVTQRPQQTLFTIKQLVMLPEFSFLTESSIRHYIFYSQPRLSASGGKLPSNGLVEAGAIIRIGRKILISAPEFYTWVKSQPRLPTSTKLSKLGG